MVFVMLITLRIWFWTFMEYGVWYTGSGRISKLKQKRWSIRLAKMKEKEMLSEQKKDLTTWKDFLILYRVFVKRLLTNMVIW